MATLHSTALRNFLANSGFKTAFDTDGRLSFFTGTRPTVANRDAIPSGTLLGTLILSATAFGSPSAGVLTANAVSSDTNADASGTPGYAVFHKNGEAALTAVAGASDKRLFVSCGGYCKLTVAALAGDTTFTVDDTSLMPASGTVKINNEEVTYTGKTLTTLTGLGRGANGTVAAGHAINDIASQTDTDINFDKAVIAGNTIAQISFTYTMPE